jgi:UDP-N-acetylmuramate: L-alanyl-gamma-D-glutamyl-meso-diaminopimelate ligase
MRMGNFKAQLAESARIADQVIWYQPAGLDWDLQPVVAAATNSAQVVNDLDTIINRIKTEATDGDVVVIMSNGGFGGLHGKVLAALQ